MNELLSNPWSSESRDVLSAAIQEHIDTGAPIAEILQLSRARRPFIKERRLDALSTAFLRVRKEMDRLSMQVPPDKAVMEVLNLMIIWSADDPDIEALLDQYRADTQRWGKEFESLRAMENAIKDYLREKAPGQL